MGEIIKKILGQNAITKGLKSTRAVLSAYGIYALTPILTANPLLGMIGISVIVGLYLGSETALYIYDKKD